MFICQEARNSKVPRSPVISVLINGKDIRVLLDTGATRTLMGKALFDWIYKGDKPPPLKSTDAEISTATGTLVEMAGVAQMKIRFQNIEVEHSVFVAENIPSLFIIGNDFMVDRITIQEGRHVSIREGETVEVIPLLQDLPRMRGVAKSAVTVPAHSRQLVRLFLEEENGQPINTPGIRGQDVLLTKNVFDPEDDEFFMAESVGTVEHDGSVWCLLENRKCYPGEISEETPITNVIPVEAERDGDQKLPCFREYKTDGHVYFLHDSDAKDSVLSGSKDDILPVPAGYDADVLSKETTPITDEDIEGVKAYGLSKKQRKELSAILRRHRKVFSTGPADYGKTPLMAFTIDTGDAAPVASRYRPIPAAYEKEVRQILGDMEKNGIIEKADSPWNSTLVLVRKPNGSLRICANLKGVNAVTKSTTSYPINQQEESYLKLAGARYLFVIDLSQAYYAIAILEGEHRDKTAFSAFGKQFRFCVSPFGAKYLPSKFNHLMTMILGDLNSNIFYYFDDIIGAYDTADAMLAGLNVVLRRLLAANLRVNFNKSKFALTELNEIKWLGSIIHGNRIKPDHHKVAAIIEMPTPKTRKGLMRFIGCLGYHRRHIRDFSTEAAPLLKLLSKKNPYVFGPAETAAFERMKKLITEAPALTLPDMSKPFILTTDASDIGVGGCLSQPSEDGNEENVVAYCSRILNANERNGSSCEKEIIAMLFGTASFYHYLANNHFTLRTDSRGLMFLRYFRLHNNKLFRASLMLDELSFDIEHQSATRKNLMGVADMISRSHEDEPTEEKRASYKELRRSIYNGLAPPKDLPKGPVEQSKFYQIIDREVAKFQKAHPDAFQTAPETVVQEHNPRADDLDRFIESSLSLEENKETHAEAGQLLALFPVTPRGISTQSMSAAQKEDAHIATILTRLSSGEKEVDGKWVLRDGVVGRIYERPQGETDFAVLIPDAAKLHVMDHYHGQQDGPHLGRKKMYATMRPHVTWKGMAEDVKKYCQLCSRCQYETPNYRPEVVLNRQYKAQEPNETVSIDIVGPYLPSTIGRKYILTMECEFSKFVCAVPLYNKTARAVAQTVMDRWVNTFGLPRFIRSDEGTDTDSALLQYVCEMMRIRKLRTPIYSPQANPVERFHQTMNRALRSWLYHTSYREWDVVLSSIVSSYNNSIHTATKVAPAELFLGRRNSNPYVPIIPEEHPGLSKHQYLVAVRKAQRICTEIARKNQMQQERVQKKKPAQYRIGDIVLVRNHTPAHKLASKWTGPYTIIEVKPM